jgi:peptidoglycan/xylan/chitin deacetylase (PgdA/CDA1 family)
LKMLALRGWENKPFPKWPLDRTADRTLEQVLVQAMRARGVEKVPFIWFWPKGHSSAIVMTHDVEAQPGLEFCPSLMDLNDRYGIKSSFQFVPEGRYAVTEGLLEEVRRRGFEVNVHDWNHDGFLFSNRLVFLERVKKINSTAAKWAAEGFRGGALYRNQEWFDDFNLAYDLSVPNVGHLDPQPGGCCSLLPYFVGRMLEIPLTCVQDYMLFHMLNDYSIDTWKRQVDAIIENHGMASFIVHPDYILEERPRAVYSELLAHLAAVGAKQNAWVVPPGKINRWWRDRSRMVLVQGEARGSWKIEGTGKEEACVAFATVRGGELVYELAPDAKLHPGRAMSEALS